MAMEPTDPEKFGSKFGEGYCAGQWFHMQLRQNLA
jgi:hypothetical protein